MASPLFHVAKGFFYGSGIGLFFAVAIYLLALAVKSMGFLPVDPAVLAGVVFAGSVVAGVAKEYSAWLDDKAASKSP
ncbi:MAG: hypothetical protein QXV75_07370 [Candidatus Bathyarchaeia archaeon]